MKITRILLFIIYLFVAVILSIYMDDVLFYLVQHFNTGWVFTSIFIRILVIILFALGLRVLFSIFEKLAKMHFAFVFLIAIVPGFLISFALTPIYEYDYGMFNDNQQFGEEIILKNSTANKTFTLNQEYNLVAFFTSTCPHCKLACQRISATTNGDKKLSVNLFFPGTEEDTEYFLKENNGDKFNYHLTEESAFLNFSGAAFPSIFLVDKEGNTLNHWMGDELNYTALDYLNSLEH